MKFNNKEADIPKRTTVILKLDSYQWEMRKSHENKLTFKLNSVHSIPAAHFDVHHVRVVEML